MLTHTANEDSRLSLWLRVREFAVPPSMIDTATARRRAGDWAGACAAAGFDVDLSLRSVARVHGQELATRVRADLRRLAPDLLRWHMPRIAPDGLLRPGLTLTLARYGTGGDSPGCDGPGCDGAGCDGAGCDGAGAVHLVVRTPPAWAAAGQRISLALWDGSRSGTGGHRHPRPRPHPRYRLDLHRHLWDAHRAGELRSRAGADRPPGAEGPGPDLEPLRMMPGERRCAVDRWPAEAGILLRAEGRPPGAVTVRLGARHRLLLKLAARNGTGPPAPRITATPLERRASALPVLPDAATWALPDLELIRAGLIRPDQLHPLVALALAPDAPPPPGPGPRRAGGPHLVECRGARHRIGLVDGVLSALDHDPDEIRREELLAALTGTPLPCLREIGRAHREPDALTGVRERLDHGDIDGALAVVEGLLGRESTLPGGALRDELEAAARGRVAHGLFRAGLAGPGPAPGTHPRDRRTRDRRAHPRHATTR
ncbi:hypothetical protein [Streptomyces johnsoniae]|uniref:Uncharacterized protein n=1 Tax=Streptomyces johnsoniae TaxID=3075532 RepID=A0ABU2S4Y3_9ACTN|nr:hypothetical protein [Streptomyces sp. DSM 41886]MDT0444036.1 hypothetical protein [Streptomyces sp. DSM 41886]